MPILKTDRLILRPFLQDDAEDIHRLLDIDPDVWRFDPGYARSWDERLERIRINTARYQWFGGVGIYAVELQETGHLIGQSGLNTYLLLDRKGFISIEVEVMYTLGKEFWGKGYATETGQEWVRYAFEELKLKRLVDCPAKNNIASIRVLKKLGFHIGENPTEPERILAILENPGCT